jgi:hypothetical protein
MKLTHKQTDKYQTPVQRMKKKNIQKIKNKSKNKNKTPK